MANGHANGKKNGNGGHGKSDRPKSGRNTSGLKRGGSPGRKPGVPNRATVEIKEIAARLLDETYYRNLKVRLDAGKSEKVAMLLHSYLFGIPKKTIQIESGDSPVVFTLKIEDARDSS